MPELSKRIKNLMAEKGSDRDNIFSSMMVFGIGIAIIYWALDTFLHVFFSDRFNVLAQIVGQDLYEIYIRLIVLCLFVIFGSHAQYTINIRREAEEELREYRDHLEELVKERTAELVESNTKLKQEVLERKRSENAHRESEEKYRTLVENSKDAIVITNLKGDIQFANKTAVATRAKKDRENQSAVHGETLRRHFGDELGAILAKGGDVQATTNNRSGSGRLEALKTAALSLAHVGRQLLPLYAVAER